MIRDRIVVGVLSDRLSDHLQNKADLTLAQAVKLCRQAEERNQNKPLISTQNAMRKNMHPQAQGQYSYNILTLKMAH